MFTPSVCAVAQPPPSKREARDREEKSVLVNSSSAPSLRELSAKLTEGVNEDKFALYGRPITPYGIRFRCVERIR